MHISGQYMVMRDYSQVPFTGLPAVGGTGSCDRVLCDVMGEDCNFPAGIQHTTLYQAELSLRGRTCSFRVNELGTSKQ